MVLFLLPTQLRRDNGKKEVKWSRLFALGLGGSHIGIGALMNCESKLLHQCTVDLIQHTKQKSERENKYRAKDPLVMCVERIVL